jgi:hypothetical protein
MQKPRIITRPISLIATQIVIATGALLVTTGCDSNDPEEDWMDIAEVRISPDSTDIPVGGTVDFSFALLSATGDTVRGVNLNTRWESTEPSVSSVEDNGLAKGKAAGAAKCVIEVSSYQLSNATSEGATKMGLSGRAGLLPDRRGTPLSCQPLDDDADRLDAENGVKGEYGSVASTCTERSHPPTEPYCV